jgi:hypothetical protein
MKTNLDKHLAAIALSIAMSLPAAAQVAEPQKAKPSGGGTATSTPPANPNTPGGSSTTGLGSIKDSPLSDPETLFKRLDTNHDGKLTQEEFNQIQSVLHENKPVPKPGYESKGS